MKKLIFFLFFLLPLIGLNQVMNHFEDTTSSWYVASNFLNANQNNPSHLGVKTKIWKFHGDTIMNGSNWNKLYSLNDPLINELNFEGYLRSENSKIYFKKDATSQSHKIYDFDFEMGDSIDYNFEINGNTYQTSLKVKEVDSVVINGQPYKRFKFTEPQNENFPMTMGGLLNEIWIEGIGSLKGPLFSLNPFMLDIEWGQKVDLTCSFINNVQYFHNEIYSDCYIEDVLSIKKNQVETAKIYPNPAKDFINVSIAQNCEIDLEVINSLGQIIFKTRINENQNKVDISNLKNGIYFLKLKQGSNIQIKKINKE